MVAICTVNFALLDPRCCFVPLKTFEPCSGIVMSLNQCDSSSLAVKREQVQSSFLYRADLVQP